MSSDYSIRARPTADSARPQLIGRDDLLARANALLASPTDAPGGIVLVGDGGVGKSRLAAEIARLGSERGYFAVSTVGTQAAAAIPLGALGHLLPDLAITTGDVLASARAALAERAAGRRLLLSVDDAHLLDDHSAALVLQLSMSMRAFVVATVRSGESVPDPVRALWKEGLAERIEVERLDDASIAALVQQVLGAPIDPRLAGVIVDRADGNALVARELSLAGRDAGTIAERDGHWSLTGELGVSARLVELVTARVDDLDPAARGALDVVALGEPLGLRPAQDLTDGDVLIELERRGLVALREDGRRREVWLSHPVYADVLRATVRPMLAASIKGRLAAAAESTGMRRRSDLLRVATWQLEAGTGDSDLLQRAATEAYRAGDMIGTARLAAGAWDQARTAESGLLLATALAFTGRHEEADAVFAAAEDLAAEEAVRTRIAIVHAAILSAGLGQPAAAIELLATTEADIASEPERTILRAQRAHLLALSGDAAAALALTEPILAAHDSGVAFVTAAMATVIAYGVTGAHVATVETVERALPETRRLWATGEVSVPPEMLELEAYGARVASGELDAPPPSAITDLPRAGALVVNRPVALLAALHVAMIQLLRGRPRSGAAAIEAVGPLPSDLLAPAAAALLATCAAVQGRVADAARDLERAESWRRPGSINDPFGDLARIWVRVAQGQPETARRLAVAALDGALDAQRWEQAGELAHALARIGGAGVAAIAHAALERIGDRVDGTLPAARREHVAALVADDADGLEAAAGAFAEMGAMLLAAEAAMDAARAARRAGEARRATRLARLSAEHAARCEGVRTPALVVPDEELTPLSRRELEIADLAASGLSSEAIAGRLFLSARTVDNHLGHVYQKLGIGSRAELQAALGRRDR